MFRRRRGVYIPAGLAGTGFVTGSAQVSATSDGTSTSLAVTAPANTRAGDLIVVTSFYGRNANAGSAVDTTPTDGYLTYSNGVNRDTILIPADFATHWWYRTAVAAEPSSYTIEHGNASAVTAVSMAFRGFNLTPDDSTEDGEDDYDNWPDFLPGGTISGATGLAVISFGGMSQNGTTAAFNVSATPTNSVEVANARATQHATSSGRYRYWVGYVLGTDSELAANQTLSATQAVASGNVMGAAAMFFDYA